MHVESKIIISKPAMEVWNFFSNPDNFKRWLSGFINLVQVSGTAGTVGARSKHYYHELGKDIILDEEIIEVVPGKKFSSMLTSSMMDSNIVAVFNETGNEQTEFSISSDTKFKGFLWKQIGPLMKGEFKKRQEADLRKLKQVIEEKS